MPFAASRNVILAAVLLLTSSAIGQEPVAPAADAPQQAAAPIVTPAPADPAAVKLSSGDLVEVTVFGVPDLTQTVRISSAGDISLSLLNQVRVAGLTAEQAQKLIKQKLMEGGYLKDPHVSIFVKEYSTQGVSVLGEVSRPGIYPALGDRRLYDLISAAGGLTKTAGKTVTITRRESPDAPLRVTLSADAEESAAANVPIMPGDTIQVLKAGLVYVVGDVARAGGFVMENNEALTVMQALALAQGANRTAALKSSRVIRKIDGGMQEIPVPLDKMLSAKANDMPLQPGDVLFVPSSAAKGAAKRTIDAIVQVATGLAIYGPR